MAIVQGARPVPHDLTHGAEHGAEKERTDLLPPPDARLVHTGTLFVQRALGMEKRTWNAADASAVESLTHEIATLRGQGHRLFSVRTPGGIAEPSITFEPTAYEAYVILPVCGG